MGKLVAETDENCFESVKSRNFYVNITDSMVHKANLRPIWGRQDPGGPHVGPMNITIWVNIINPINQHSLVDS